VYLDRAAAAEVFDLLGWAATADIFAITTANP
jgi:hypothetical protein